MLHMQSTVVDMSNVNLRKEKHGKSRKLGVDITIAIKCSNAILNEIEKGLREAFFRKAKKDEQMDLVEGSDGFVAVRHPSLTSIPYGDKFPGYELEIAPKDEGAEHESLFLDDVTVKDISWTNIEGGSIDLSFKLQAGVGPEELAAIAEYYTHKGVRLTLTPPTARMQTGDAANDADGGQPAVA